MFKTGLIVIFLFVVIMYNMQKTRMLDCVLRQNNKY